MLQLIYQLIICLGAEKEMKKVTLQHVLENKILEYDVDDRGVIIDEREKDRYAKQQDSKEKLMSNWINEHIVFQYDVKKQGATNETLKGSAYLQDLSGKGRRMKLSNFLFAEMSGVGGYNTNFSKWTIASSMGTVDRISSEQIIIRNIVNPGDGLVNVSLIRGRVFLKCNITGITEELKGKIVFRYASKEGYFKNKILDNGYFEFDSDIESEGKGWAGFTSTEPIDNCSITITQIPEYPGALVADGVDDYGGANLAGGIKILFMTVNPITANKMFFSQRLQEDSTYPFVIYNGGNEPAYNYMNPNGVSYINGVLNNSILPHELVGVKHTITLVNDTANSDNTFKSPIFFNGRSVNYYAKLAFYNSIAFDSIPTEADGFTEQELIDYVIDKYELK